MLAISTSASATPSTFGCARGTWDLRSRRHFAATDSRFKLAVPSLHSSVHFTKPLSLRATRTIGLLSGPSNGWERSSLTRFPFRHTIPNISGGRAARNATDGHRESAHLHRTSGASRCRRRGEGSQTAKSSSFITAHKFTTGQRSKTMALALVGSARASAPPPGEPDQRPLLIKPVLRIKTAIGRPILLVAVPRAQQGADGVTTEADHVGQAMAAAR